MHLCVLVATLFCWGLSPSPPLATLSSPQSGTMWSHLWVSLNSSLSPPAGRAAAHQAASQSPMTLWVPPHPIPPSEFGSLSHSETPSHLVQSLVLPHNPYFWGPSSVGNDPTQNTACIFFSLYVVEVFTYWKKCTPAYAICGPHHIRWGHLQYHLQLRWPPRVFPRQLESHLGELTVLLSVFFLSFCFKIDLFIFGCTGSLLLHMDFLQLQWTGVLFAAVLGLLIAVASLVAERRL